ncbi:MAG: hypothetical protein ACJ8FS_16170 [Sphingomicrobium sp.]
MPRQEAGAFEHGGGKFLKLGIGVSTPDSVRKGENGRHKTELLSRAYGGDYRRKPANEILDLREILCLAFNGKINRREGETFVALGDSRRAVKNYVGTEF